MEDEDQRKEYASEENDDDADEDNYELPVSVDNIYHG